MSVQFFNSDGVRLAFRDVPPHAEAPETVPPGRGDPIVLVHGFASNHAVNWVNTLWLTALGRAGFRVVLLDNRGHGQSEAPHAVSAYASDIMAQDVRRLMDRLSIKRADVMGYSMGARIAAHLALANPERVRSLLLGGLGIHLVDGVGLPENIAEAMEAADASMLVTPMQRMFRAFAESTKSDLKALAACIRGTRQTLTPADVTRITAPTLVSVGTKDEVAGDPHALAALMPDARALDIEGRDHNLAVGDRSHKAAVLAFLAERP